MNPKMRIEGISCAEAPIRPRFEPICGQVFRNPAIYRRLAKFGVLIENSFSLLRGIGQESVRCILTERSWDLEGSLSIQQSIGERLGISSTSLVEGSSREVVVPRLSC